AYNSQSQIAARVWTFARDEPVDSAYFRDRLRRALGMRELFFGEQREAGAWTHPFPSSLAFRIVNAESDGLPGLVVDRYGDWLVVQVLTLGAATHIDEIVASLEEILTPRGIYERSDVDVRKREGLPERVGRLRGAEPPDIIEIEETGLTFLVDVKRGHKTGFYLDQRVNRQRAARYLNGALLNAFAYTGAFGVYAASLNGAAVTNLDSSASALELARANFRRNQLEVQAQED